MFTFFVYVFHCHDWHKYRKLIRLIYNENQNKKKHENIAGVSAFRPIAYRLRLCSIHELNGIFIARTKLYRTIIACNA